MIGSIAHKNDKVYRFSYTKNGKQYRKSVYAKNMAEASNKLKIFIEQINKTNKQI